MMLERAATHALSRTPLEARIVPGRDLVHVCAYRLLASLCACVLSCKTAPKYCDVRLREEHERCLRAHKCLVSQLFSCGL